MCWAQNKLGTFIFLVAHLLIPSLSHKSLLASLTASEDPYHTWEGPLCSPCSPFPLLGPTRWYSRLATIAPSFLRCMLCLHFSPHYLPCSMPSLHSFPHCLALTLVFTMCLNRYCIDLVIIIILGPKFCHLQGVTFFHTAVGGWTNYLCDQPLV